MHLGLRFPQLFAILHDEITNVLESLAVARSECISSTQRWLFGAPASAFHALFCGSDPSLHCSFNSRLEPLHN